MNPVCSETVSDRGNELDLEARIFDEQSSSSEELSSSDCTSQVEGEPFGFDNVLP